MIRGNKVQLRPVRRSDLEFLAEHVNDVDFRGEYNDFGLRDTEYFEQAFAQDGLLNPLNSTLVVTIHNEQVIGTVSYHMVRYGSNEGSRAYNIGIGLDVEYRGKGYGVEAQRLLTAYIFSTYTAMRVEATTDIENAAEQRALEKAGFTREGVLRKAQWRSGAWHDLIMYSKLRGE
ncbi:MAG: GNAT family protein [Ktedonobacteraceae bacterium]